MSEKDMQLGGMAATKFTSKNSYDGASSATYKSSDQVRDYYLSEMERMNEDNETGLSDVSGLMNEASSSTSTVPDFWASRQKERDIQAQQMGVFARQDINIPQQQNSLQSNAPSGSSTMPFAMSSQGEMNASTTTAGQVATPLSPEVALIQIATNTLETMAAAMESNTQAKIPMSERAAFANAMKRAMAALAKQSS